jgi:hypothetical protein
MLFDGDFIFPGHLLLAQLASSFGYTGQPLTWEQLSL